MTHHTDVFARGRFQADRWTLVADDAPLPDGPVLVSLARWRREAEGLTTKNRPVGLILEPSDRIEDIADDLPRFAAIAVCFPAFADGRGYSIARLLRDRYGFTGELRAVGDILLDQVAQLFRVGFDTLAIDHAPTRARLLSGAHLCPPVHYQPALERATAPLPDRPWTRVPYQDAWCGV
jgi:phosphoadenosine phosphosulfate reductase